MKPNEKRNWTKKEEEFIEKYSKDMTLTDIMEALNRSAKSVRGKISRTGLPYIRLVDPRRLSDKEIEFIRTNYQNMTIGELADGLGRSYSSIQKKLWTMRITAKPEAIKAKSFWQQITKWLLVSDPITEPFLQKVVIDMEKAGREYETRERTKAGSEYIALFKKIT